LYEDIVKEYFGIKYRNKEYFGTGLAESAFSGPAMAL
jgi:hypothetical protein